ncbi:hypothetical protein ACIRN4_01160 [Pimelobacter simplex]|uniref:hypothetical protein n=1 Tax=Nocardioides simplex TaxID=2045 RepID=UPI0037FE33C0
MNRIGHRLLRAGRIDDVQLATALRRQSDEGGYLGQHLLESGAIDRLALYDALARQWELAPRDLVAEPPVPGFTTDAEIAETVGLGWVACGREASSGALVVATTVRPGPDLLDEIVERYPGWRVELVACTQRDLDHVAAAARRRSVRGGRDRSGGVPVVRASGPLLLAAVATAALVVAPVAAVTAVAVVASLLFALASLALVASALGAALRRRPDPATPDSPLPLYSVLVRLTGGPRAAGRALANLAALDYPTAKLDVLLLVAEDDASTRAGIRRAAPPDWVRVVPVAADRFASRELAHDDGLALAHGRYVVAYAEDEVPAPDQLRSAVAAFEGDLDRQLDPHLAHADARPPLGVLDVQHRLWRHRRTLLTGLAEVDGALLLDDTAATTPGADVRRTDRTSVHAHLPLLRRLGGWSALGTDLPDAVRVATLASSSTRSRELSAGDWLTARATTYAAALRGSRAARGALAVFLPYAVALFSLLALAARGHPAVPATVALATGLGVAVLAATVLTARRHGAATAARALLLPGHWTMQSIAAWAAALVVVRPRAAARPASP